MSDPEPIIGWPGAIRLTADTVFTRPVESCVGCGYSPGPNDYPLIDGEECEECHFDGLQAIEAGQKDDHDAQD